MESHPINLAIRFLLELAGLAALAWMGCQFGKGAYRYICAIGYPLAAAVLWGVFTVPGILRLFLELGFFAAASWSLFAVGATKLGWIYAAIVFVHYLVSYDRVLWLAQQ